MNVKVREAAASRPHAFPVTKDAQWSMGWGWINTEGTMRIEANKERMKLLAPSAC